MIYPVVDVSKTSLLMSLIDDGPVRRDGETERGLIRARRPPKPATEA